MIPKKHGSLGIIRTHGIKLGSEEVCVICKREMPLSRLTVAALNANGSQALACYMHTWDRAMWLIWWIHFVAAQEYLRTTDDGIASLDGREGLL